LNFATDGDQILSPSRFRDLVSGRRRGPLATLARAGLRVLEWPYTAAVNLRNRRYDRRVAPIQRVHVPVISVGNITLGGTGKTPTVEWIARWLLGQGVRVVLVSRGYGAQEGEPNDEALELARKLPNVPHLLNADRAVVAQQAIDRHDAQLVLLDDAFQHRRLARDLDLVLIDATEPFGFGHVFPRGTLREPLAGLARADVIMLSRSNLVDDARRSEIRAQAKRVAPAAVWVEAAYVHDHLENAAGEQQPVATLAGKPVAAFCGIGNPAGFRHSLVGCGFQVTAMREHADHAAYTDVEVGKLCHWVDSLDVVAAVCTCKDLVKIGDRWKSSKPLWALVGRLDITHGHPELEAVLRPLAIRAKNTF
jgi:tetraacyldisaccharide 4'-kinase